MDNQEKGVDLRKMGLKLDKQIEDLNNLLKDLDSHIHNKVNTLIVKHLNTKFAFISFHVAFAAILVVAIFYVNDRLVQSSIKEAMNANNDTLERLDKNMKILLDNRTPGSVEKIANKKKNNSEELYTSGI